MFCVIFFVTSLVVTFFTKILGDFWGFFTTILLSYNDSKKSPKPIFYKLIKKNYAAKLKIQNSNSLHYAVNRKNAFLNSNFCFWKNENWTFLKMSKSEKSSTKFESENAHFFDMTLITP